MEADVTTPEQGRKLALELFDTRLDERHQGGEMRMLATAINDMARKANLATIISPSRIPA